MSASNVTVTILLDSGEEVDVVAVMCEPERDTGYLDWWLDTATVVDSTHELTQTELERAEARAVELIHDGDAEAEREFEVDGD